MTNTEIRANYNGANNNSNNNFVVPTRAQMKVLRQAMKPPAEAPAEVKPLRVARPRPLLGL